MKKIIVVIATLAMLTLTACGASTTSEENFNKFSKNLENFCKGDQFDGLSKVTNQKEFNEAADEAYKKLVKTLDDVKDSEVGGNLDKFKNSFVKYGEDTVAVIKDGYKAAENSFNDPEKMQKLSEGIMKDTKKLAEEFNKVEFKESDQVKEVIQTTKGC
jgi:thymidylate synthase